MPTTNLSNRLANWPKKTQFSRLSTSLLVDEYCFFKANQVMAEPHSRLPAAPCDIIIVFGSDVRGMPSFGYKLYPQIRNRTARNIAVVTLYWLDNESALIGGSVTICGLTHLAVAPSESGPCETIVQQIGEGLVQRLGKTTSTEIINHQLTDFHKFKQCAINVYDFRDSKPNTYQQAFQNHAWH